MKLMALIVIEGLDGSGKGTQAKLLYDYALSRGRARQVTFPDYGSPSSSLVKMYLKGDFGKEAGDVNAYAASAFYAVDRFASYRMKWKDDYASGVPIISDRYVTSNIVYQLSKLPKTEWKAFVSWLEDLEYEKFGLPRPDRVIYLWCRRKFPKGCSQSATQATPPKKTFTKATYIICYIAGIVHCTPQSI